VTNSAGKPVANATVQVWQPDETGNYDLQKHDPSEMDLRGTFKTDANGGYYLRTIVPMGYMIPMDGPVGDMIRAQKRHGYRPAHIHFIIGGPGYREVVTALYLQNDAHIDSDTVFGVTASLVTQVNEKDSASPIAGLASIKFDCQLPAARGVGSGRVGADPSQIVKKAAS
jgi:catechol 1,2-dioxygenase/hydroxyquinol 1,2-dioxygenase